MVRSEAGAALGDLCRDGVYSLTSFWHPKVSNPEYQRPCLMDGNLQTSQENSVVGKMEPALNLSMRVCASATSADVVKRVRKSVTEYICLARPGNVDMSYLGYDNNTEKKKSAQAEMRNGKVTSQCTIKSNMGMINGDLLVPHMSRFKGMSYLGQAESRHRVVGLAGTHVCCTLMGCTRTLLYLPAQRGQAFSTNLALLCPSSRHS